MSISYIEYTETKFFHNLKVDNNETNQLNFLHQRKLFLYQKLVNNHKQNGSEIKIQTMA